MTGYQRLTVPRGRTWRTTLDVTDAAGAPLSLTGADVVMQVRSTVASVDVLVELSTANGRIAATDPGELLLELSAAETAALDWSHGVYDVRLVIGEEATPLLRGEVLVDPAVTR